MNGGKGGQVDVLKKSLRQANMKKNIYLVDDDDNIRMLIEYLLGDIGFDVTGYATATGFQQRMEKSLPDLVILDIILPDGNGLEICRELKSNQATSHIPVLLMSANLDNKMIAKAALADGFFSKPFDINDFAEKVQQKIAGT